ncbi:MAG: nuclear transport factor 2 family protein [Alphaproteobacteria bacterium]
MNDNAKLIAEVYAAFGRGDIPAILAKIADNAEWNGPANKELPYAGSYKGSSGAAKFFDKIASHLRVTAWEPKSDLASGDEVMTMGLGRASRSRPARPSPRSGRCALSSRVERLCSSNPTRTRRWLLRRCANSHVKARRARYR